MHHLPLRLASWRERVYRQTFGAAPCPVYTSCPVHTSCPTNQHTQMSSLLVTARRAWLLRAAKCAGRGAARVGRPVPCRAGALWPAQRPAAAGGAQGAAARAWGPARRARPAQGPSGKPPAAAGGPYGAAARTRRPAGRPAA